MKKFVTISGLKSPYVPFIASSSNGRTSAFGAEYLGSNPSEASQVLSQNQTMLIVFLTIGVLVVASLLVWCLIFYFYSDFTVPTKKLFPYKKVSIVFPHPDDECLTVSGLVHALKKSGAKTTLILLTLGERGTPTADFKEGLKTTRTREAKASAKILGIDHLVLNDFGDGALTEKKQLVKKFLHTYWVTEKPDLIVTYDLTGVYGHPDHITCAEIVTELVTEKLKKTELWYHALPEKVLSKISLPEHMAKDPHFKEKRVYPSFKVSTLGNTVSRIQSMYAHYSQRHAFESSMPIKSIPLWFYLSAMQFEYFHLFQRK